MDKNTFIELAKDVYKLTLLFPKKEPLRYKLRQIIDDLIAEFVMEGNDYAGNIVRLFELMVAYLEIAASQDWAAPAEIAKVSAKCEKISREFCESEPSSQAGLENAIEEAGQEAAEVELPETAEQIIGQDFVIISEESKSGIIPSLPRDLMDPKISAIPMIGVESPIISNVAAPASCEKKEEDIGDTADDVNSDGQAALTAGQIARQNRIMEFLKEKGSAQVWEIQNIFPSVSKRTIRRDFRSMLEQGLIERTGERNTTAYKPKINLS